MSLVLGTLCLNEMEWLPRLYEQHKDWPGLARWVFVEAADRVYADVNPGLVTRHGLSVDGTSEFLMDLAARDRRVVYIPHGFSEHKNPAEGKRAARQRYLGIADQFEPEFVVVLDADEFYTHDHQRLLVDTMRTRPDCTSYVFLRREIWRPPCWADQPLLAHEVVGGFWELPCCHWWRWVPGMNYHDCHNTPSDAHGRPLNFTQVRFNEQPDQGSLPQMVHLGYAVREHRLRLAKNTYYHLRGEAKDLNRDWYVASRAAWETWQPGDPLPVARRGEKLVADVIPYTGPKPECFQ